MAELGKARMLFQSKVRAALVKCDVFPNEIGFGETCFHVAEFIRLSSMDIAKLTVLVDSWLGCFESILDRRNGREGLVFYVDQVQSFRRHIFIDGGNGSHWISYHSHSV